MKVGVGAGFIIGAILGTFLFPGAGTIIAGLIGACTLSQIELYRK